MTTVHLRFVTAIVFGLLVTTGTLAHAQLRATLVVGGLQSPLAFIQNPADSTMQVILQQDGRARVLKNGALQTGDFLDLRGQIAAGGEQGLLGLAFAPNYATSGRVFTSFTDRSGNYVIARFVRSSTDPLRVDPASRFDFRWPGGQRFIPHPFTNHNGGNIAFGPDGFLYVGTGDGGSANDPLHAAQNPLSLLGKMLRLNVQVPDSDAEGYDIPSGNPFAGRADVLGEIWALGLRNPWRWSFDDVTRGGTGALVIADVGQGNWEEVDYQPASVGGRNYGWRNREGAHANVTSQPPFSQPLIDPIWEYSHAFGNSITGGFVYRGTALGSSFVGRYFFADFGSSRLWSLGLTIDPTTREAAANGVTEHSAELGMASSSPSSFGVDAAGELYIVNYSGTIYRLDGPPGQPPAPEPDPGPRRHDGDSIGKAKPRP